MPRQGAAERQAKRRSKIKESPQAYQEYLEKDRDRKRKKREESKKSMTPNELQEFRVKERQRIRNYRAKKAASQSDVGQSSTTPYRSSQARGKAVKRAAAALPFSPKKKLCVVETLAKQVGLKIDASPASTSHLGLSEETRKLVLEFYNRNDVSWQAPGRKDRVIIREKNADGSRSKQTVQVRYLLMSLKESHQLYSDEHPQNKIGLSKYCELRPHHVKLFDHIPHNVCVCSYHENVRLLLVALKEHTALSIEFRRFINQVTCDSEQKNCMSRECEKCKGFFDTFAPKNPSDALKYYQWQKNCNDKVEKVEVLATVGDAFNELEKQLRYFLVHTYVKRKQSAHMADLISKCNGKNIVLQVDFSENATIESQNEIQSAHWTHGQATLFTAHAWIDEGKNQSFVVVSDDLSHTKQSVYAYMTYIFKYLKVNFGPIEVLNVFSDGAGSQFKQKFLFSNLHSWECDFNFV